MSLPILTATQKHNMTFPRYHLLSFILLSASISTTQGFQNYHVTSRSRQGTFSFGRQCPSCRPASFEKRQMSLRLILADSLYSESVTLESFTKNTDFWVFLVGIFPFAWATVEFWRRIAFGEPFGTGSDSVVIGMDDSPMDSRGRRVLGRGALITAYVLFALAFSTIGIVIYSIVSSDAPPEVFHTSLTNVEAITEL